MIVWLSVCFIVAYWCCFGLIVGTGLLVHSFVSLRFIVFGCRNKYTFLQVVLIIFNIHLVVFDEIVCF